MSDHAPDRWELGSEFHWCGWPPGPYVRWPDPARWYGQGRHAVSALMNMSGERPRLWLPDYFCEPVIEHWRAHAAILFYRDDPRWPEPEWQSLQPRPGDYVLAVNYFGVRQGRPWQTWEQRVRVCLLEDHSHDPVSGWAMSSQADYAFASLRKTLPVPDGAILWSPRRRPLPPQLLHSADKAVLLKLSAMVLKAEYLAGRTPAQIKEHYRRLQQQGETELDVAPLSGSSSVSQQYVGAGVPQSWRAQRIANARALLVALQSWGAARPLYTCWPDDAAPLAFVLVFDSRELRDSCQARLQEKNIYCAVHWPLGPGASSAAQELSSRLLSLPADQRYNADDIRLMTRFLLG